VIDREHQAEIEQMVLSLEDLDDVQALLALLAKPAGSAFQDAEADSRSVIGAGSAAREMT
jgi:hypothetical protein